MGKEADFGECWQERTGDGDLLKSLNCIVIIFVYKDLGLLMILELRSAAAHGSAWLSHDPCLFLLRGALEAMPGDPADQRGEIVGGPAHLPFILFFLVCVMSCFAATPSDVRRWLLVLLLGRCLEVSQPHDPFVSSGYLASVGAYSHNLHQRSRDLMQNVRMLGCDARDL